ncbi:MAG: hypothetical protein ACM3SU_10845 [Acidobacteriota bacterium]
MEGITHPPGKDRGGRPARTRTALATAAACAALLALLTGCGPPLPPDAVFVHVAPPGSPVEVIGVAPGPDYVWIRGHHRWSGSAYVWVPGHWAARPRHGAVWIDGHWAHHHKGWYWRDGHWK